MARNVGSIEVVVNADTGRLKAQVVKGAKAAGEAGGEALEEGLSDIDGRELMARLREIRVQAQRAMAGIEVDIDLEADVQAELRRIEAQLKAAQIELFLHPEIDDADLRMHLTELRLELREALKAEAQLKLSAAEVSSLSAEVDLAMASIEAVIEAKLRLPPDEFAEINANLAAWRVEWERDAVDIKLNPRIREAQARIDAFVAENDAKEIELKASLTAALFTAEAEAESFREAQEAEEIEFKASLTASLFTAAAEADAFREAQEQDEIEFQASLRTSLFNAAAEADLFREQQEAEEIEFTASLTASLFTAAAEADAFREEQEADEISFQVELATALATAEADAWREDMEEIKANIRLTLDTAQARIEAFDFKEATEAERIDVKVRTDADYAHARAQMAVLEAIFHDVGIDVETDAEWTGILALRRTIDTLLGDITVDVEPQLSNSALARIRRRLNTAFAAQGRAGGRSYGSGFMRALGDQGTWIGLGITLSEPLAKGLEGLFGAATSIVASGLSAIGGAIGAAAPVAFGGAAAFTAVALSLDGVGDALGHVKEENWEALQDALAELTPAARDFVEAFAEIQPEIQTLRQEVQQAVFAGLGDELRALADETIPDVTDALVIAGDSVNEFIKELSAIAQETDFKGVMEAIDPALDNAFDSATLLAGALGPFLRDAGPAAETLTGWIEDGAAALKDWVISNPRKIQDFLSDGVASLQTWSSMLWSVGDLLGTVFSGGVDDGDRFIRKLDAIVTRWDQWLEGTEGQNALEEFFRKGRQAMSDMKPVFDGLVEAWEILTGDTGEGGDFATLMTDLGEALPNAAEFLDTLGNLELGSAILNIVDTLGIIAEIFALLPDDVEKFVGQLLIVTKVLGPLNRALKTMELSFGWIALLNVAATIGVAMYDALTGGADTAALSTKHVGDEFAQLNQQLIEGQQVASVEAAMLNNLAEAIPEVENFDRLEEAMTTLSITTEGLAPHIERLHDGGDDAVASLITLADQSGLSDEALQGLAETVDSTDDSFGNWETALDDAMRTYEMTTGTTLPAGITSFEQLADATGVSMDELLEMGGVSEDAAEGIAKIGEETGEPISKLLEMGGALEQVQDSAEDIDMNQIAEDELRLAAVSNDTTQAILEQAAANLGLEGSIADILAKGEDLPELYREYVQLNNDIARTSEDAAVEASAYGEVTAGLAHDIAAATAAGEARVQALEEERDAAFEAWQEEEQLGEKVASTAAAVAAADYGIPIEFAEGIIALGEAWETATNNASAFQDVMEAMRGGIPDLEAAISGTEEAFRAAAEGIKDTNEAGEEFVVPPALAELRTEAGQLISVFDLATESGAGYAESSRNIAEAALEEAAAMIQSGASAEETTARMEELRGALVEQLVAWKVPRELAEEYASTLLGTPTELSTAIAVPGLLEALMGAEDLTVLYDDAGNPVITEFEALGIDITEEEALALRDIIMNLDEMSPTIDVGADGIQGTADDIVTLQGDVTTLDDSEADPTILATNAPEVQEQIVDLQIQMATLQLMKADPTIELSDYTAAKDKIVDLSKRIAALGLLIADPTVKLDDYAGIKTKLDTLQTEVLGLSAMVATPSVRLDSYATVKGNIDTLQTEMNGLSGMVASPSVRLDGYTSVMQQIDAIETNLNSIQDESVTVRINTVRTTTGGAMAGAMIGSPQNINVGERGYAEAIVPLQLPLNRVAPEVRDLAALLRGEATVAMPTLGPARPQSSINQYFTLSSADPGAVAVQALNRAAAMAT